MSSSSLEYLANRLKAYEPPFGVIGIGLPGTRKTDILQPLAEILTPEAEYLTYKAMEAELFRTDPNFSWLKSTRQAKKTWAHLYRTAKGAIDEGRPVIIDSTHTSEKRRWTSINQLRREMGATAVVGVYFKVEDPQSAWDTITKRRPQASENSFENMSRDLRLFPPSAKYEKFDELIEINAEDPLLPIVN